MSNKVYTIKVEDKVVNSTAKKKEIKTVKSKTEKEVENFGIVEINNASATKKVKNTAEKGFEKNVVAATKKSVKAKVNEVEDYFDFSFRKNQKAETKKVEAAKKEEVEEKTSVLVSENVAKETTQEVSFDSDAYRIVMVARVGSLFDCDKRMINA